jgi:hypothetical protein
LGVIDLKKKSSIILEKRGLKKPPPCRIGLALDVSGSMRDEFEAGLVQNTVDRMLAYASHFDDNGEMEVWTFDHRASEAPAVSLKDHANYVEKSILNNPAIAKWGVTEYGEVCQMMVDYYFKGKRKKSFGETLMGMFGRKKAEPLDTTSPTMILFITDGENEDTEKALRIFEESQKYNIYWQLVGVSNDSQFKFIKMVADRFSHAGFVHLPNLKINDEQMYDALITDEVVTWLKSNQLPV